MLCDSCVAMVVKYFCICKHSCNWGAHIQDQLFIFVGQSTANVNREKQNKKKKTISIFHVWYEWLNFQMKYLRNVYENASATRRCFVFLLFLLSLFFFNISLSYNLQIHLVQTTYFHEISSSLFKQCAVYCIHKWREQNINHSVVGKRVLLFLPTFSCAEATQA